MILAKERIREDILKQLEQEKQFQDAALVAFVLARRAQNAGNDEKALRFGRKCLELIEMCSSETLEQCASEYVTIANVFIPGIFHEGTVRRELAPLAM